MRSQSTSFLPYVGGAVGRSLSNALADRASQPAGAVPEPATGRRLGRVGTRLQRRFQARLRYSEDELVIPSASPIDISIALVPDLRAGGALADEVLQRALAELADFDPDVVCLLGNAIEGGKGDLQHLAPVLDALSPRLGTYAIVGERERRAFPQIHAYRSFLEAHGATLLRNRGVRLKCEEGSFWLAGTEATAASAPSLAGALKGRDGEEVTVLLSRAANAFEQATLRDVDLQLSVCDRSSAREVFERLLRIERTRRLDAGKHWLHSRLLFLCEGLHPGGMDGLVGWRPEIPILRLRSVQRARELTPARAALPYSRCLDFV